MPESPMKSHYVAVAETQADCRAILDWWCSNRESKLKIIALSLDALAYLRQARPEAEVLHVWEVLRMEDIIDQGYQESLRVSEAWVAKFQRDKENFYEVASQALIHQEVLTHSITASLTAKALAEIIQTEGSCYLAAPADFFFLGAYSANLQSLARHNFIFKSILLEIVRKQNIFYISISPRNSWLLGKLSWMRHWHVCKKIVYDIVESLRSKIFLRPTMQKMFDGISHVNLMTSGWGRDLSRMLDYTLLRERLKSSHITHLDLIWRPQKVALPTDSATDEKYIIVRENVLRGASYGPQLSMFAFSFWFPYLRFFKSVIRPRLKAVNTFFEYKGLRSVFAYNLIFAYRDAFLTRQLLKPALVKSSPQIFLGSDSGGTSTRAELLTAKALGIRTLSTPHGYQGYSMPLYSYLSDTVLTHSPATGKILEATGLQTERIAVIGSSHLRRSIAPQINPSKVRVVIGTRSWGGFWTNFCSRHDAYDTELRLFVFEMLKNPAFDTVIKSHPNGDYHEYYDFLVSSFSNPRFHHIPKGWKVQQFAEFTDILVCFGEMPSLYISALYLKIPIVFISGTMTKTQAGLNYDYKGLGCVVKTAGEAVVQIAKLTADPSYYAEVMQRQNKFADGYDTTEPEERIVKIINS